MRACIGQVEQQRGGQLPLNVQVPELDVGISEVRVPVAHLPEGSGRVRRWRRRQAVADRLCGREQAELEQGLLEIEGDVVGGAVQRGQGVLLGEVGNSVAASENSPVVLGQRIRKAEPGRPVVPVGVDQPARDAVLPGKIHGPGLYVEVGLQVVLLHRGTEVVVPDPQVQGKPAGDPDIVLEESAHLPTALVHEVVQHIPQEEKRITHQQAGHRVPTRAEL